MGRILCLHGMGCNGMILRFQLAPLMKRLGSAHEFVFLDGEIECPAAEGIGGVAPGPYLCYHVGPSMPEITAAHEQILDTIEDEGPFDGVVGFSQGAAVAASLLLDHAINRPSERPPFNFAIFYSSILPFSPDGSLYKELIEEFIKKLEDGPADTEQEEGEERQTFLQSMLESLSELREILTPSATETENAQATRAAFEADPMSDESCRPYHSDWIKTRIAIPTLHVFGKDDPLAIQSRVLYDLCSTKERTIVQHAGGHDVPRDDRSLQASLQMAEKILERSKLVASGMI